MLRGVLKTCSGFCCACPDVIVSAGVLCDQVGGLWSDFDCGWLSCDGVGGAV